MTRLNDPINDREYRAKQRNESAKRMAKTITQNLYTYLCVAIPVILIGTIWTEFTLPSIGWGLMGDGVLTVALFVLGERLAIEIGAFGGKMDDDYHKAKARYETAIKAAKSRGIMMLTPFCEWQINLEFDRARRARCSRLRIKYDVYTEQYQGKPLEELKTMLPLGKAVAVDQLNKLEPIELTADMLLFTGSGHERREISLSGDEYKDTKIYGRKGLVISVLTCVFCVGLPLTFIGGAPLSKVVYTLGKFVVLLWRMFRGYSAGARAYHTIDVRHMDSKSEYLEEYVDFIDRRIYLTIANEYTDIDKLLGTVTPGGNHEISCFESYQGGAGDGDRGGEPDTATDKDRAAA